MDPNHKAIAHRLIYLLERLSADSHWAHRASGLRGALIKAVTESEADKDNQEISPPQDQNAYLELLIQTSYDILTLAAREIRTPELTEFFRDYSSTGK